MHSVLKQKSSGPGQAEVTAEIRLVFISISVVVSGGHHIVRASFVVSKF